MDKHHIIIKFQSGAMMAMCYGRGYQKRNVLSGLVTRKFFEALPEDYKCKHCIKALADEQARKAKKAA